MAEGNYLLNDDLGPLTLAEQKSGDVCVRISRSVENRDCEGLWGKVDG